MQDGTEGAVHFVRSGRLTDHGRGAEIGKVIVGLQCEKIQQFTAVIIVIGIMTEAADHQKLLQAAVECPARLNIGENAVISVPGIPRVGAEVEIGIGKTVQKGGGTTAGVIIGRLQRDRLRGGIHQEKGPFIVPGVQTLTKQKTGPFRCLCLGIPVGTESREEGNGGLVFFLGGEGKSMLINQLTVLFGTVCGIQNGGNGRKPVCRGETGAFRLQQACLAVNSQIRTVLPGTQRGKQTAGVFIEAFVKERAPAAVQSAETIGCTRLGIAERGDRRINGGGIGQQADRIGVVGRIQGMASGRLGLPAFIIAKHHRRITEVAESGKGRMGSRIVTVFPCDGSAAVHQQKACISEASQFLKGRCGVFIPALVQHVLRGDIIALNLRDRRGRERRERKRTSRQKEKKRQKSRKHPKECARTRKTES